MDEEDGAKWAISLLSGIEIRVTVENWEVDCPDDAIKNAVEDAIHSVIDDL